MGTSQGYDNTALATRRRDNLINYLRQNFNSKSLNLIPGTVKVGDSKIKDSEAAMKQQYVSVEVSGTQKLNAQIKGEVGDNTTRDRTIYGRGLNIPDPPDLTVKYDLKICVTIPKGFESQYIKLIRQFKNQYDLVKMGVSKKTI